MSNGSGQSLQPGTNQWSWDFNGPDPAQTFRVGVQCSNVPTGGTLGFTVDKPSPDLPEIVLPTSPILSPDMVAYVEVDGWPADAYSQMDITYTSGPTPPPSNASITPFLATTQPALGPTVWSVPITGPSPASTFWAGVQCFNVPVGGQLGFTVASPGPGIQPVTYPVSPITNPNMMVMASIANWPAGASSQMTVTYQPGATPPPAGASIQVTLTIPVNPPDVAGAPGPRTTSAAAAAPQDIQPIRLTVLSSSTHPLAAGPDSWPVPITGPTPAQPFFVNVQGSRVPTDGRLGFSIPGPGPGIPPVIFPPSPVTSPSFSYGVEMSDWPAGATSTMMVNYLPGPTQPPPGASVTVQVLVQVGP